MTHNFAATGCIELKLGKLSDYLLPCSFSQISQIEEAGIHSCDVCGTD